MTLLETALQIKTDEARQTWIVSLSEDDKKEFFYELSEEIGSIVAAFQPIMEVIQDAVSTLSPLIAVWYSGYEAGRKGTG